MRTHALSDQIETSAQDYLQKILLAPVYEIARQTPLDYLPGLSERLGNEIFLKREDLQILHSFKIRGAYNCIANLSKAQQQKGVIAASAGNHAQGVALSAHKKNLKAFIVMPETSPNIKIKAVRRLGAEIILSGENFDQANQHALKLSQQSGAHFIPPFDHPDIIAGQGTIALEMSQQKNDLDMIFIPVGGGGLIAGMAAYYKALLPDVKIIGVEPERAASLQKALQIGQPTSLDQLSLFADGVAVKRVGEESFRLARRYVDQVITVSNDEICAAVKDIFEDTRAISEPSGALSLAGLKTFLQKQNAVCKPLKLAAILSGANVNFHNLRYISERCALGEQEEAMLAVTIPERPDSFRHFTQTIGDRAVTEFNYRYTDVEQALIFVGIQLTKGQEELTQTIQALRKAGYPVKDLSKDETAKMHIRYMAGGKPPKSLSERIYSFEFPEHKGSLTKFLALLDGRWNISLFHYRHHGLLYGRVLIGFQLAQEQNPAFQHFLEETGFTYQEETENSAYQLFLKK